MGCTYQHTVAVTQTGLARMGWSDSQQLSRKQAFILPADSILYVAYPKSDDPNNAMPRFRTHMQQALVNAGEQHGLSTHAGGYELNLYNAMSDALLRGCDFLMDVNITQLRSSQNHDDASGEYQIYLKLYDVRSSKLLETLVVTADSGLAPSGNQNLQQMQISAQSIMSQLFTAPQS